MCFSNAIGLSINIFSESNSGTKVETKTRVGSHLLPYRKDAR